ncbi:MAG TPA: hypothetical protein VHB01_11640 [Nitrosospira sp.]|nr:hypothetical protein [Nitrosospira sp.]
MEPKELEIVYRTHPTGPLPILLLIAFSAFCVFGTTEVPAQTEALPTFGKASEAIQRDDGESEKKIRKITDLTLKSREASFREQARSLARGYRETAEMIVRQGGDPKPILDAAAYFERQAEVTSRVSMGN